jgi:hypothetical protein
LLELLDTFLQDRLAKVSAALADGVDPNGPVAQRVTRYYEIIARDNHQFAQFNKIGLDQAGNPEPADLHLAWAAGTRAVRLTLR